MQEIQRNLQKTILDAMAAFRVVVVSGPRQAGKSTVVRQTLGSEGSFARLDVAPTLAAALHDPEAFVAFGPIPRAIDEIQRGGEPLVRAIKAVVDVDRRPGQYLLNGSANFLTVPTISESLAGRAVFLELWPFTQSEISGTDGNFLARIFEDPQQFTTSAPSTVSSAEYFDRVCTGGFPEVQEMSEPTRAKWFRNYVRTITQRDIAELTNARQVRLLPKVLKLLATRTAGELVVSHIQQDAGLSRDTTESYIGYLHMVYLVHSLPAWSRNMKKTVAKHPKVYVADSGLAAHLLGKSVTALARPMDPARGPLLETFVVNEIMRLASWNDEEIRLHHFRDRDRAEVDLVLENPEGRVVAVEVKASGSVNPKDAKSLAVIRNSLPNDFHIGIVFYTGDRPYSLGDRLVALPISYLWN